MNSVSFTRILWRRKKGKLVILTNFTVTSCRGHLNRATCTEVRTSVCRKSKNQASSYFDRGLAFIYRVRRAASTFLQFSAIPCRGRVERADCTECRTLVCCTWKKTVLNTLPKWGLVRSCPIIKKRYVHFSIMICHGEKKRENFREIRGFVSWKSENQVSTTFQNRWFVSLCQSITEKHMRLASVSLGGACMEREDCIKHRVLFCC